MAPSTLDLFILTFNCAKNFINVPVFASHLRHALSQNATQLPDLVVFSLQEVAPLSYAFMGSYFLEDYYTRFQEALNIAAVRIESPPQEPFPRAADPDDRDLLSDDLGLLRSPDDQGVMRRRWPYQLVRTKNVGMTAIMLFARDPAKVHDVQEAETSFGAGDIGNKGAVGLRVTFAAGLDETTELTFVAAHLAAMEWNLKRRNSNWRSIVSGLTFANPKAVLAKVLLQEERRKAEAADADGSAAHPTGDEDTQPLLAAEERSSVDDTEAPVLTAAQEAALRNISIFKASSHLFLAGDLNYRISTNTPPALAPFPSFDRSSENYWAEFLPRDQLLRERDAGRTLNGLSEHPIAFGPTYKYVVLPHESSREAINADAVRAGTRVGVAGDTVAVVPWRWAGHRWPSWCDRVLFWQVPQWVRSGPAGDVARQGIDVKAYSSLPVVRTSDHRAVFLRAAVPMLSAAELGAPPPSDAVEAGTVAPDDPRVKLPVPVDVDAWERRAKARRKEIWVGWSMYVWSTRDGAVMIGSAVLLGVVSWWLYTVIF